VVVVEVSFFLVSAGFSVTAGLPWATFDSGVVVVEVSFFLFPAGFSVTAVLPSATFWETPVPRLLRGAFFLPCIAVGCFADSTLAAGFASAGAVLAAGLLSTDGDDLPESMFSCAKLRDVIPANIKAVVKITIRFIKLSPLSGAEALSPSTG